jgi:hypothetical protein
LQLFFLSCLIAINFLIISTNEITGTSPASVGKTKMTLHLYLQIVGKIRLKVMPRKIIGGI